MGSSQDLREILIKILGNKNVYFQPPASLSMNYPAIIYSLNDMEPIYANNQVYSLNKKYSVTLIHDDPDNTVKEELARLRKCKNDNCFTHDNLYHYVFTLYY